MLTSSTAQKIQLYRISIRKNVATMPPLLQAQMVLPRSYNRDGIYKRNGASHCNISRGTYQRGLCTPASRFVLHRQTLMRARVSPQPDEPMAGYIRPSADVTEPEVKMLLTVLPPLEGSTLQLGAKDLRLLNQEVCNRKVDRTVQDYPYSRFLWPALMPWFVGV